MDKRDFILVNDVAYVLQSNAVRKACNFKINVNYCHSVLVQAIAAKIVSETNVSICKLSFSFVFLS